MLPKHTCRELPDKDPALSLQPLGVDLRPYEHGKEIQKGGSGVQSAARDSARQVNAAALV